MDDSLKLIIDSFGKDRFKFDEPLKYHTSRGIGGPAKLFFIAFTKQELVKLISMCRQLNVPFLIYGTGSKIMISDWGFNGLVIKNSTKNIHTVSIKGKVSKLSVGVEEALVEVDSGVSILKFVEFLDSQGLSTLEVSGIPGSIGGNLFISSVLQSKVKSIKVLDLNSEVMEIESYELNFRKHIVLSANFKFKART